MAVDVLKEKVIIDEVAERGMYKVLGNNVPSSSNLSNQAARASTSLSDSGEEESNIPDSGTTTHHNAIADSPSKKMPTNTVKDTLAPHMFVITKKAIEIRIINTE